MTCSSNQHSLGEVVGRDPPETSTQLHIFHSWSLSWPSCPKYLSDIYNICFRWWSIQSISMPNQHHIYEWIYVSLVGTKVPKKARHISRSHSGSQRIQAWSSNNLQYLAYPKQVNQPHMGKDVTRAGNNLANMLVTCWQHADNMQATCGQHAGNMLVTC